MAFLINRAFVKDFIGTPAETKPILKEHNTGSTFIESDTDDVYIGDVYIWNGSDWKKI